MKTSREYRMKLRQSPAFGYTNSVWNNLNLNSGWSIGLLMKITENVSFQTFEEWEEYYFETAKKRQVKLQELPETKRLQLMNLRGIYTDSFTYKEGLTQEEINLNEGYGRTLEELRYLALHLYKGVLDKGDRYGITPEECFLFTYIRVIDEAWIGMARELNTIQTLENAFPHHIFIKTTPDFDRRYSVDVEMYDTKRRLLCGIQIKSTKYHRADRGIINSAKKINEERNGYYEQMNRVPVLYAYSSPDGAIQNKELYDEIKELEKKQAI